MPTTVSAPTVPGDCAMPGSDGMPCKRLKRGQGHIGRHECGYQCSQKAEVNLWLSCFTLFWWFTVFKKCLKAGFWHRWLSSVMLEALMDRITSMQNLSSSVCASERGEQHKGPQGYNFGWDRDLHWVQGSWFKHSELFWVDLVTEVWWNIEARQSKAFISHFCIHDPITVG